MLIWYKKFVCGLFYFLRNKVNSDIPKFAAFLGHYLWCSF